MAVAIPLVIGGLAASGISGAGAGLATSALIGAGAYGAAAAGVNALKSHTNIFGGHATPLGAQPQVPTTDTASMAAAQQNQQLARQRGVLANIYAGNNPAAASVATKMLLGQ